jgi:tripartite-type tricarboxylate transporter receptor subunit TctC
MRVFTRAVVSAILGGLLLGTSGVSIAQAYPNKPIRVIVAFPPGAPHDVIVRLMSDRLTAALKQPLVIENRPGAGGNIAAEFVAKSPADGYTLLATIDTVVTVNPHIYKKLTFRPESDLVPVIYLANTAQTLVCHPSVPARNLGEFIAHARTNSINYASGGPGVPGHIAMELFLAATGLKMTHVPYKGPAAAMQDVLGGQVPCGFLSTPVVMPHVKTGKLLGYAVTPTKRSVMAPDMPTVAEAGVPGYDAQFGEMILAPRGVPEPAVRMLADEMGKILAMPDIRERMLASDMEYVTGTPATAAARLARESAKWKDVVERIKLQVD